MIPFPFHWEEAHHEISRHFQDSLHPKYRSSHLFETELKV